MRRALGSLLLLLAVVVVVYTTAGSTARAEFISAPDVVVYCDGTLSQAARSLGRAFRVRTGVPVRVFSAPGPQQLELIAHGTRSDVLMTQSNWMDEAAQRKLIDPATRTATWYDRMVLAGPGEPSTKIPAPGAISTLLAGGKLGVIDPAIPGGIDGPALVEKRGWQVPEAGEISGPGVAFLVRHGEARLGLLQRTAALQPPALPIIATVPDATAPAPNYSAAVDKNVLSRNAAAFEAFLNTPEAAELLRQAGLEATP
jgi:molybdate transport system substrate-binding protein